MCSSQHNKQGTDSHRHGQSHMGSVQVLCDNTAMAEINIIRTSSKDKEVEHLPHSLPRLQYGQVPFPDLQQRQGSQAPATLTASPSIWPSSTSGLWPLIPPCIKTTAADALSRNRHNLLHSIYSHAASPIANHSI